MARALRVEDVTKDTPQEVGILRAAAVPIGRDPEAGFRLDSAAVSRRHGMFVPFRSHWLYADLGSTNGSWINDIKITPKVMKIVRAGDHLQLADRILGLASVSPEPRDSDPMSQGIWSLLVFLDDELRDEFPVPKSGKALIVGGKVGDLQFPDESEGKTQEEPTIVFERRKDGLYVFQVDDSREVILNEQPLERSTRLEDNDWVRSDRYTILFNCPPPAKRRTGEWTSPQTKTAVKVEEEPVRGEGTLKTWGADTQGQGPPGVMVHGVKRAAVSPIFGQATPTVGKKGEEGGGTLTGPSMPDAGSAATTTVYTRRPVRREVYQSARPEDFEEEESLSPYKILIVVFALLSILLLIAVVTVLMG